jgi:ABC-type cobalamin/Fe3+-siderophores transport system ATPase subunit
MKQNPFTIETNSLPLGKIVDRQAEVEELHTSVEQRKENVLLLGENGIGKTCLLRKLRYELTRSVDETQI